MRMITTKEIDLAHLNSSRSVVIRKRSRLIFFDVLNDYLESFSFDGLIVARRQKLDGLLPMELSLRP